MNIILKKINNNLNKMSNNRTKDTGFIITVIVILIVVIVCIIILAVVARNSLYYSKINNAISPIIIYQDQKADKQLDNSKLDNMYNKIKHIENRSQFSISMWIYIENWDYNYGKYKIIYERQIKNNGDSENNDEINTPVIALDKFENNLVLGMTIYDLENNENNTKNHKFVKFVHKQIPLQKWVNIVYNISDQFVSLYFNEYIKNKYYLDNIFYQKGSDQQYEYDVLGKGRNRLDDKKNSKSENSGFSGRISKLQYFAKNLNNEEIQKIYENGPYID